MQPGLLNTDKTASTLIRAAQYVRMSTDHQKYSTENQAEIIASYAAERNMTIVRTYADKGLSGLGIGWRDGLKTLIADVECGNTDFECILVYDISRWGRFQDVDESAYYEFICKRAGITVHYCADEFENDGSLASVILKNVKRVAAADFSRQLSKKVFLGQSRVVRMGFSRGGMPGYGLRRQLVDEHGVVRATLEYKQQKFLQTDRIKIVHGPMAEVDTVRRIFHSVVSEDKHFYEIATELNADHIQTTRGRRWSGETVRKIAKNEAYTGSLIFNRSSCKLKQRRVENPPEMWIRRDDAFAPVVSPDLFSKAQAVMRARSQRRSDQEVIDRLAALGRENGHLTAALINVSEGFLSAEGYRRRFGSLVAAYRLAGYQPEPYRRHAETTAKYRSRLNTIACEIADKINDLGGAATMDPNANILRLSDGCRLSIGSARAVKSGDRRMRWTVYADRKAKSDLTLIVRMGATNAKIAACYLLPTLDLAKVKVRILRISNRIFAEACRYDDLDAVCRLCAGVDRRGAA